MWSYPWSKNGPTVHTFTRPPAPLHGLSSQVRGPLQSFCLHLCEELFPPEKRPLLTASGLEVVAVVAVAADSRMPVVVLAGTIGAKMSVWPGEEWPGFCLTP
jgi:hypothetical protein